MNEEAKDSTGDALEERLEELMDSFARRLRQGERPSVEEYARQNPELAVQIRQLFPALQFVEKGQKEPEGSSGLGAEPGLPSGAGKKLDRLGEYTILRELGRGGMGIVYEAEQESLGRHVALKILPSWASMDARRRDRFLLEARSAATLQHPNIVPVHGIHEENGVLYYVMQFIQGQALDGVLVELKRLRWKEDGESGAPPLTPPGSVQASATATVAWSLTSGSWREEEIPGEGPTGVVVAGEVEKTRAAAHRDTDTIPGGEAWSDSRFFRNVAKLGVQVADALAYAHENEVLHRDIKPSNLLLDGRGTVWITDFGLAKARGSDDLTQSGELVGTLKYMAPERFRGRSDPRTDVYGLGLTLYELLTLRPAFEDSDRGRLMQQIAEEEPPRPRKIDPDVPRDLETVVLKAMAKDPASRYETASALAADLNRFLAGEPVLAHPSGVLERSVKWARRRPAAAALIVVSFLAVIGMLAGSLWYNARLRVENERSRANLVAALEAVRQVLVRFGSSDFALIPDAGYLRRDVLQTALEFHRRFLERDPKDPLVRLEAARVQAQMGDLQQEAGFRVEAGEAYERALTLLEKLATEFTGDTSYEKELLTTQRKRHLLDEPILPAEGAKVDRFLAGEGASNVIDVSAVDLDGDGRLELVSANQDSSNHTIFRAGDARRFAPASNVPTGLRPYQMAVCDFDGEGGHDLATYSQSTGLISVLLNKGDGTFKPSIQKHIGFPAWNMMARDLDGNRREEIVVVGNLLRVARWSPEGAIAFDESIEIPANGNSVEARDFDADGHVDLAVGCVPQRKGLLGFRWGDETGEYSKTTEIPCPVWPLNLAVEDVDADGDQDLAVFDALSSRMVIVFNEGARRFRAGEPVGLVEHTFPLGAADFDGDGDVDLAACEEKEGRVSLLLGDGRGEFSYGPRFLSGGRAFRGRARDVNGDGQVDLIIGNGQTGDVAVMFHLREYLRTPAEAQENAKESNPSDAR